jgi:hypothetical protein
MAAANVAKVTKRKGDFFFVGRRLKKNLITHKDQSQEETNKHRPTPPPDKVS